MKRLAILAVVLVSLPCAAGPNRWTTTSPGITSVGSLQVDPANPSIAFASTSAGIYKTLDGGQSWQLAIRGLPGDAVDVLIVAPDRTLYAAIRGRIYVSTDLADQWSLRASLGTAVVTSLVFDSASETLLATASPEGNYQIADLYVSHDQGVTWTRTYTIGSLNSLISIAASQTAIYATVNAGPSKPFFLRSTDAGRSWQELKITITPEVGALFSESSSPWVYAWTYSNLLVSKDNTATWTALPPLTGAQDVLPLGTSVFAKDESGNGVFEYDDGATSWKMIGSSTAVHDFALSSSIPRHFYAAPRSGVITFVEGDRDWKAANQGLPGAAAYDVDLALGQSSIAYAATQTGVFRTPDGGQSWTSLSDGSSSVAVSPDSPDTAYLLNNGVLKTTNGGATWRRVTESYAVALAIARSDPKTLYAVLDSGMVKSTDGGDTWPRYGTSAGLTDAGDYIPGYLDFGATSLAIDPSNASTAAISKSSGVYKTTDGGSTWRHVSSESAVRGLTIDPSNSLTMFGGSNAAGFIRSNDGGATWRVTGLSDKQVITVAANGTTLYAGTAEGHIYRSDDGGFSWIGFDDGLFLGTVWRVVVDATSNHLYAATSSGVYAYETVNPEENLTPLGDDPQRLPNLLNRADAAPESSTFLIPVVGKLHGMGGTLYSTTLTLSNSRQTPQDVVITSIPRGGDGGVKSLRLTIPGAGDASGGTIKFLDVADRFGMSGLVSLLVTAVDAAGDLDVSAAIAATTSVWSLPTDRRAPVWQSIPSADASLFSSHAEARATGLQDSAFRTNIGVVNLNGEVHQFTVRVRGENNSAEFTIAVPPFSLVQIALPARADFGAVALDVVADSAVARWLFYANSIDRQTGEAQTVLGNPL